MLRCCMSLGRRFSHRFQPIYAALKSARRLLKRPCHTCTSPMSTRSEQEETNCSSGLGNRSIRYTPCAIKTSGRSQWRFRSFKMVISWNSPEIGAMQADLEASQVRRQIAAFERELLRWRRESLRVKRHARRTLCTCMHATSPGDDRFPRFPYTSSNFS
jgi:hypothetical protein